MNLTNHAGQIATGMIALALLAAARATTEGPQEAGTAMEFQTAAIGAFENIGDRTERSVNPRLEHIRGWISAVGAAVAFTDLDNDGRPNDICLVETRTDRVTAFPAPGTGRRYGAIELVTPSDGYRLDTVAAMGCLPGDYNEDGRTDLLVYFWGRPPIIHFRTDGQSNELKFRAVPLVAAHEPWFTNAAVQADVDGDGYADLVFGNYFPEDAAVLDVASSEGGIMQRSMSRATNGGRNRLFLRFQASGTASGFVDFSSTLTAAMANGWTLALAASDLNGDLLPELYVANDFGPDRLLVNLSERGQPRFRLATGSRTLLAPRSRTLGRDSFKGMGAEFTDVNGDGLLDLAVSNIAQEYALLESHFLFINGGHPEKLTAGVADFRDESGRRGTARNGWGWDIKAADFDNDGRPELLQALGFLVGKVNRWPELQELATANDGLVSNPRFWAAFRDSADLSGDQGYILYAPDQRGFYRNVSRAAGIRAGGAWRGIAVGDINMDGRLDAAVARQWGRSALLINRSGKVGNYLSLDLRVRNPNGTSRPAIGAIARVRRIGGPPLIGVVDGGNGHSGKRAPMLHFGLGSNPGPFAVTVEWREAGRMRHGSAALQAGHHRLIMGRTAS